MAVLTNGSNTVEIGATTWRALINDNFTRTDRVLNQLLTRAVSTTGAIAATDGTVVANAGSGAIVLTLPASGAVQDGHTVRVRVIDATNTVTVQRAGSDIIDDAQTSIVLSTLGGVTLQWSTAASRWVSF
jgi:hypothetical protein